MYINKKKIAILMTTFNGERFISQQIESVISQSLNDFTLYIRDDCSTDSTRELIQYYANRYPSIIIIIPGDTNIGSKRGFLYLMDIVDSRYYMFCDQDDVWKSNKVEISYNEIRKLESKFPELPIIVHTDLELVNGDLELIDYSYWAFCKLYVDLPHGFRFYCHFNDVTGCTMMFNRISKVVSAKYLNIELPYFIHHDHFISLIVSKNNGIIKPIHKSTIYFRRHGGNSTDPFKINKSIFHRVGSSLDYFRDLYRRKKFFSLIGYSSFLSFIFYKVLFAVFRRIWKKMHV